MPRSIQLQRLILGLGSGTLLLNAMIYGPGRGLTIIPGGDPATVLWDILRVYVYVMFLAGSIESFRFPRLAATLLFAGLVGRCVLEFRFSLVKLLLEKDASPELNESLLIGGFYLISFVIPATLFLDCLHELRRLRRLTPDS